MKARAEPQRAGNVIRGAVRSAKPRRCLPSRRPCIQSPAVFKQDTQVRTPGGHVQNGIEGFGSHDAPPHEQLQRWCGRSLGERAGVAACAETVNQVLADPSGYRDRKSGSPARSSTATRSSMGYRIDDGTGQLWVVSDKSVPHERAGHRHRDHSWGFNLGSLGDRINVPLGLGSGLVLMESSHKPEDGHVQNRTDPLGQTT